MILEPNKTEAPQTARPVRLGFSDDFRRFFLRGLAALMPTLITLWLLIKVWDFLWESLGRHIIWFISLMWIDHYLRTAIGKKRLWRNIRRVATVEAIMAAVVFVVGLLLQQF